MTTGEQVEVTLCETLDEAIAEAVSQLQAGDEVIVHAATCAADLAGEGCTCEPYAIVVPEAGQA